jgi:hypothetical protein
MGHHSHDEERRYWMSDGREERKEQEERRRWQEPKDLDDELDRDWPRDNERERGDS